MSRFFISAAISTCFCRSPSKFDFCTCTKTINSLSASSYIGIPTQTCNYPSFEFQASKGTLNRIQLNRDQNIRGVPRDSCTDQHRRMLCLWHLRNRNSKSCRMTLQDLESRSLIADLSFSLPCHPEAHHQPPFLTWSLLNFFSSCKHDYSWRNWFDRLKVWRGRNQKLRLWIAGSTKQQLLQILRFIENLVLLEVKDVRSWPSEPRPVEAVSVLA